MKKKGIIKFIALAVTLFSLTACESVLDMFGHVSGGGYSYRPIQEDIPTPNPGNTQAKKAGQTYSDYIDNNLYPLSATPSVGTTKLLVIPVWFTNSSDFISENKKDNVKEDIEYAYFGTNEQTGWRSVKTFYEEESHGALTITGTVSDWYYPNKPYADYGVDASQEKTMKLVVDSVNWYFANNADKREDYDCDNDGYLDGVMLIYAAPDFDVLKSKTYTNLWAYCYWIQNNNKIQNNNQEHSVNAFFWASYDFMYGSEKSVERTGHSYIDGDTSIASVDTHTYIHEMGHMFGLTDYYDYSEKGYRPAASFSMQDHNVGGHDPFSSFSLGWGKAYIPTESTVINLKRFAKYGEMIILTPKWNDFNSAFDEYLILEYYDADNNNLNSFDANNLYMKSSGKSYPEGTKERGIRLWHVDARLLYSTNKTFNSANITSNACIPSYKVTLMASNTYFDGNNRDSEYLSPLAAEDINYCNYNILQLIRNRKSATYLEKDNLNMSMLFKKDDEFTMSEYNRQFVNAGKLNSNVDLGFSFKVNALNKEYASISITKL